MNDPIKIIHKYKNNNNRIQYHIYIFIGDIVDENCMKILKKISDLDFFNALVNITESEHNILIKNYGDYWYEKFFNIRHINFIKDTTLKNTIRLSELDKLFGKKWRTTHFAEDKIHARGIEYSYEAKFKETQERRIIRKLTQSPIPEEIVDYTTQSRIGKKKKDPYAGWCDESTGSESDIETGSESEESIGEIRSDSEHSFDTDSDDDVYSADSSEWQSSSSDEEDIKQTGGYQTGGADENEEDDEFTDTYDPTENNESLNFDEMVDQDLEEANIFFQELDDIDKNIKNTTKNIKDIISNELYDKLGKKIVDFDVSKDNNMFDENLKNVFEKQYITHQYIHKDDVIKVIKNKITCAVKNNPKFGDNAYIIPSQQYLWSEYEFDDQGVNKLDKVMIGHKWIIKNNILKLDIEPNNNLRVYEELRGNLKTLRDNIRRQGKIKLENDDNNILHDYNDFYTNNEIYMIDILNEFGLGYDPSFEDIKNVSEVYTKIYFPKIKPEDISNIIYLLKNPKSSQANNELSKYKMIYETANNDLILENEIMKNIELVNKQNPPEISKIFKENHIIQSVIRAYITERYTKINLFRIFNNFVLGPDYPFIQYQPTDNMPRWRYNEKQLLEFENKELIMKWFENSHYGINFRVKVQSKRMEEYMTINLTDNGRIDYKIQWKEEEMHTMEDTVKTYKYAKKLIEKINAENSKFGIKLHVPENDEFNFAFINTIQKIELPEKFVINHNDLSDFSRCFFPYISLIIDPRKRQAKVKKEEEGIKSKFGTYLRYKRISDYENKTKIEHRILFFIRSYEHNDQSLANEISKEFNLTLEQAIVEINLTREKYPNVKKSRKVLKKLENIPKYKPPGIEVSIQGKQRENYKMKVAGARDKDQLDKILEFMHAFFYLYVETYLYKIPARQKMKDYLKRVTKIAKLRNKVDVFVDYGAEIKSVKQTIAIDKDRLGYKAGEKVNSWAQECQNSGTDKRRQPKQFLNATELIEMGYVWNDKLDEYKFGHYSRKAMVDDDGLVSSKKKKHEVNLRAVKLALDDSGSNFIYYVCGPENNGRQMYVGFLGKKDDENSAGGVPCCFIKDQFYSANVTKRNLYLKSIGLLGTDEDVKKENEIIGDQLYILQDTNKIYESRLAFLPKYLDIFMNLLMNNTYTIRNHYLINTTGYYFKYGVGKSDYKYLNAVGTALDLSVDEIKQKIISTLESDKSKSIFTSLANGDIRTRFTDSAKFITYIKTNTYLEYELLNDILCIPNVLRKHGINIVIFQKKIRIIRRVLEKEQIKESYHVICQNSENIDQLFNPQRQTIFLIKDGKSYYPIVKVNKKNEETKEINTEKTFAFMEDPTNIIKHVSTYYKLNCQSEFSILVNENKDSTQTAKNASKILLSLNKKDFQAKFQFVDGRFKCRFIITQNEFIIPTIPSGAIYNLPLIYKLDNYIKDYDITYRNLIEITKITDSKINVNPIGIFYEEILPDNKNYVTVAIMTSSLDAIPVQKKIMTKEYIRTHKLSIQKKPNENIVDNEIMKGPSNKIIDDRVYSVSKNKYELELYQLFRLHLSYYLNNTQAGLKYKTRLENLVTNTNKYPKRKIKIEIKKTLYLICSRNLLKLFNELIQAVSKTKSEKDNQNGGNDNETNDNEANDNETNDNETKSDTIRPRDKTNDLPGKWLHILPNSHTIDYISFEVNNNRELCYNNTSKQSCGEYKYCHWSGANNSCALNVKNDLLIDFINKVSEEIIQNGLKSNEVFQKDGYSVSDIVSYNIFTERAGEKVIMGSHTNIKNILEDIFGKEAIPKIGKRLLRISAIQNYDQINDEHPIKKIGEWYVQTIVENKNTIFRAFVNTYYWLMHPFTEIFYKNLGYYSELQTELSNVYKSFVIEWLNDPNNKLKLESIKSYIKYDNTNEFIIKLGSDVVTLTSCIVELYVLSTIYETLIYVYNENYDIIYAIHPVDGIIYDHNLKTKTRFDVRPYKKYKKTIDILFRYISKNIYPDIIEAMYPLN